MSSPALGLLLALACVPGMAATLQLSPQQVRALEQAQAKALASPEDLDAAARSLGLRSLAVEAPPPATRVSGLLLDAARNAPVDASQQYGVRVTREGIDAVLLAPSPPAAAALAQAARRLGATVRDTVGSAVFVTVPVGRVPALEQLPGLVSARPDWLYESEQLPAAAGIDAAGIAATHVAPLHVNGITGSGVSIGIIDMGFARYGELQDQGVVPPPAAMRKFGAVPPGGEGAHGTACAEIVHAMAPGAQLWLARFDGSESSALKALQWIAEQHVDIISASWEQPLASRRGNTPLDQEVDRLVRDRGILWVAAGGNDGATHWAGLSKVDPVTHQIEIPGSPMRNMLALDVQRRGPWHVSVTWDDWPGGSSDTGERQDIDLHLYWRNGRSLVELQKSNLRQQGHDLPVETIVDRDALVPAHTPIYVALVARHVTKLFNVHVNVSGSVQLTPSVAAGSLSDPATAHGALAVAAYDVRQHQIAAYSAQGPTDDGRMKPEVSGPANVTTVALEDERPGGVFEGTSAAVAHVSGFAALLAQARHLKGAELKAAVLRAVQPLGKPSPNYVAGYGLIDAALAAPIRKELPGSPVDDALERMLNGVIEESAPPGEYSEPQQPPPHPE